MSAAVVALSGSEDLAAVAVALGAVVLRAVVLPEQAVLLRLHLHL